MNLYEYQAKKLMVKYNLPVLKGFVYGTINDIEHAIVANSIGSGPWVVKCQIQAGGRGKSGGVCIVHSSKKLLSFSNKWIGNRLVTYQTDDIGELVCSVLIEPAVKIIHELYLSVSIDRDASQIICMASTQGGVNVEMTTDKTTSNLIHKIIINPSVGIYPYQGRILACKLGLSGSKIDQFSRIIVSTTNMLIENDLTLIEINPLAITDDDHFCCLDAKVIIDQNAIFRQSNLLNTCTINKPDNTLNFNYIPLEGNIGCMVNGAGLAMATMDVIKSMGGIPANFLDIGGGANKECIISAFNMILKNTKVLAILVNIFGGIVCCDLVAECILTALSKHTSKYIPIIARLEGNNSTLGSNRLINSKLNIFVTNNLIHAIQKIVTAVNLKNVNFN